MCLKGEKMQGKMTMKKMQFFFLRGHNYEI
jgi:hypothetical protein